MATRGQWANCGPRRVNLQPASIYLFSIGCDPRACNGGLRKIIRKFMKLTLDIPVFGSEAQKKSLR